MQVVKYAMTASRSRRSLSTIAQICPRVVEGIAPHHFPFMPMKKHRADERHALVAIRPGVVARKRIHQNRGLAPESRLRFVLTVELPSRCAERTPEKVEIDAIERRDRLLSLPVRARLPFTEAFRQGVGDVSNVGFREVADGQRLASLSSVSRWSRTIFVTMLLIS